MLRPLLSRDTTMLEFNVHSGAGMRVMVVLVSAIARFTPSGVEHTAVTLTDGLELTVVAPFARFREAVSTARSQVVSLLETAA
jgi:hypothetical protein